MIGVELRRITEDSHCINTTSKPLASLNENTPDELHTELHSFNIAESRSSLCSNKRSTDDSVVKATIMWRPVAHNVKEEPNELRCFGTSGIYQQRRKSFTATNSYKKVTYGEKENVESGSGWARGSLEFSNCAINVGLSSSVDGKRLQEGPDILSKPVTRPEMKVVDEATKAVGGPGLSFGDCKLVNRYTTSPSTAILGTRCAYSPNKQPDFSPKDSMCFESDSSIHISVIESRKGAHATALVQENMKEATRDLSLESTLSMKSPLLSLYQDGGDWKSSFLSQKPEAADPFWLSQLESRLRSTQNSEENVQDVSRLCHTIGETPHVQPSTQNMGECSVPVFSESDILSLQDAQTCEKISTQNNDHFVVLFSEQKALKGSCGRKIRQELSKLSSFCSQYSRKIQSWATCLATGKNISGCLRCLQQFFSTTPRGFVNLKSHNIPEFSARTTSRSSSRKLAKDKELKAVLLKINEVLVSMERTSLDSTQESNSNFKSHEGLTASGSCLQHDSGPCQQQVLA